MSITEIMARARRVVRKTFGENAEYTSPHTGEVTMISVSWHNRVGVQGNIADIGFTEILEGVNRAFFNREELNEKGLVLEKAGRILLTDPLNNGTVLILDSKEPPAGPINEVWNVVVP